MRCNHRWKSNGGICGLVDYNGVIVNGTHLFWICKWCGKHRSKISTKCYYKVYKRSEVEAFRKSEGIVMPPEQLEFWNY